MNKYRLRRIGVASNAAPVSPSLSDCIELVLGQVNALAADVLDALKTCVASGEAKPEPASDFKSEPDPAKPGLKTTVDRLLAESDSVRATVESELRRLVYQSGAYEFGRSPLNSVEDIHVADMRELEVHIEKALARQEVLRSVEDVLPLFDALVSSLLGWSTVQPALNPMRPDAFIRALDETLEAWVEDDGVRMEMLRPASIALGTGMHLLYREASDWMRSQGVVPVESPTGKPLDGSAARMRLAETEVERTMATLDKLRRLLAGDPYLMVASTGIRDFTHTVPGSMVALQDLKLVEPMMKRLAERATLLPVPGSFSGNVSAMPAIPLVRSQAQNQQIGRQLGEEVVAMMLDQLVQNERLALTVRAQLRALEPVLVRLAKSDPRFFIDRAHPARQLLDRIAQRSLAFAREYEDRDGEGMRGFVACVAYAVNSLTQGPGDASACASSLETLEQDLSAFEAMRRRLHEDALNARQHTEQRMLMAQRFSGALMERFKSSALPEFVASFLRGPWSQVLAEAHLRIDSDDPDPRGYLALVDDVVWSVQPPLVRLDYARLLRLVPHLLGRLNEGLATIRYPQEPVSLFLDELSALHERALEDHRRARAAARDADGLEPGAAVQEAPEETPSSAMSLDGLFDTSASGLLGDSRPADLTPAAPLSAPRDLMLGSVVDLLLEGDWVRADLTWISHNRTLFMFVSDAGLSHAMSRRTMDRLDAQGRIRVISSVVEVDFELDLVADGADADEA